MLRSNLHYHHRQLTYRLFSSTKRLNMPVHHLMVGTWTPPGAIFTFAFDTDKLSLTLLKRTEIPKDEPISWMTFSVCPLQSLTTSCTVTNMYFSMTGSQSTVPP